MKSLYVQNLRESVKEGELFRTCDAIELFCREVLEYKKSYSHRCTHASIDATMLIIDLGRSVSVRPRHKKFTVGVKCYHFFRSGVDYNDSGLVASIVYEGQSPSLSQMLRIRRSNLDVNSITCFGYGVEWKGKEEPAFESFGENLHVRAPKLKEMSIEDVIRQYERNSIKK